MMKKAQMGALTNFVIGLLVIGMVLAIALTIMSNTKDTMTGGSAAEAAVNETIDGIGEIPGWIPVIVVAVIGVSVLLIVLVIKRVKA